MIFLEKVCTAFSDQKLQYAVVGGHAVALHGAVRGTVDIDFVFNWTLETLTSAVAALDKLGLVSRLPINAADVFAFREEYILNRNLIAWNFYNPANLAEQVDIIINYSLRTNSIKTVKVGAAAIPILKISKLIKMKQASGREQDLLDIDALVRIENRNLVRK